MIAKIKIKKNKMSQLTNIDQRLLQNNEVMEYGFDLIASQIYDIGFKVTEKLTTSDELPNVENVHKLIKMLLLKYLDHEFVYENEQINV